MILFVTVFMTVADFNLFSSILTKIYFQINNDYKVDYWAHADDEKKSVLAQWLRRQLKPGREPFSTIETFSMQLIFVNVW